MIKRIIGLLLILLFVEELFILPISIIVRAQPEESTNMIDFLKRAIYEGWGNEKFQEKLREFEDYDVNKSWISRMYGLANGSVLIHLAAKGKTRYIIEEKVVNGTYYNIYLPVGWEPGGGDTVYVERYENSSRKYYEYRLSRRVLSLNESWVYVGRVTQPPSDYDANTWMFKPVEGEAWVVKDLVDEEEAKSYVDNPGYRLEKDGGGIRFRQTNYFKVYRIVTRVLYHHYKWVEEPIREFIKNGNVGSSLFWLFESFGEAFGELCASSYTSEPSCLRIMAGPWGRGAWRQAFSYDGSAYPVLEFSYRLSGKGMVTIKAPDGGATIIPLGASSEWARFSLDVSSILAAPGEYEVSFVAQGDSELHVDDVSIHTGGWGEWVYLGDVDEKPGEVPEGEDYKPFHRVEWEYVGRFSEDEASSYSTNEYAIVFDGVETTTYYVDLYVLYEKERMELYDAYRRVETASYYYEMEPTGRVLDEAGGNAILLAGSVGEKDLGASLLQNCLVERVVEGGWIVKNYTYSLETARHYNSTTGYRVRREEVPRREFTLVFPVVPRANINGSGILGREHVLSFSINNAYGEALRSCVLAMLDDKVVSRLWGVPSDAKWWFEPEPDEYPMDLPKGNYSSDVKFWPYLRFDGMRTTLPELAKDPMNVFSAMIGDPTAKVFVDVLLVKAEGSDLTDRSRWKPIACHQIPYVFESDSYTYQNIYKNLPDWAKGIWNGAKRFIPSIVFMFIVFVVAPEALPIVLGEEAGVAAVAGIHTFLFVYHYVYGAYMNALELNAVLRSSEEFKRNAEKLEELAAIIERRSGKNEFSEELREEAEELRKLGEGAMSALNVFMEQSIGFSLDDLKNVGELFEGGMLIDAMSDASEKLMGLNMPEEYERAYAISSQLNGKLKSAKVTVEHWASLGKVVGALAQLGAFYSFANYYRENIVKDPEKFGLGEATGAWATSPLVDAVALAGKLARKGIAINIDAIAKAHAFVRTMKRVLGRVPEGIEGIWKDLEFRLGELAGEEEVKPGDVEYINDGAGILAGHGDTCKELVGKLPEAGDSVFKLYGKLLEISGDLAEKTLNRVSNVAEKSEDAATGLVKWLSNGKVEELEGSQSEILDELIPELVKLDKKGLDGIGKALAAKGIGDSFENGLKLFKTYFDLEKYYSKQLQIGEERVSGIIGYFLDQVKTFGIKALEAWSDTLEYSKKYHRLGVPLRVMKYGEYVYPCLSKGLAEELEFKEGDVVTLSLNKGDKEYRALAHIGAIGGTVVVYPQKVEGGGALMGAFDMKDGDYVATLKGAVEPDYFFSTAKEIGEDITLISEGSFGKFLSYNNPGICIIEYEEIGGESHYKIWDSNGRTVTLKSYGEGVYALRLRQVSWEELSNTFTTEYLKNLIEYKVENEGIVSIKDSSVSAKPKYKYDIKIGNEEGEVISGAILWELELGSGKKLWIATTIDPDGGKWLSKVEYVSEPHAYLVRNVEYITESFTDLNGRSIESKILKIYYEDNRGHVNRHYMYLDPATGGFKNEFISVKDPQYSLVEDKLLRAAEGASISGKLGEIEANMREEFQDAFSYGKCLLDPSTRGYAAYALTEKLLLENYQQNFGYDSSKPVLKTAGENTPEVPFDIMQVDGNKIILAIEEKSLWSPETPKDFSEILGEVNKKLDEAIRQLKNHKDMAEQGKWIVPEKGYAIVAYITPEKIFFGWVEVKLGG